MIVRPLSSAGFAVLVLVLAAAGAEAAQPAAPPLPKDVKAFVDRRAGCDHWAGEEPYDADRRQEIARATRRLRCDRLERDERRLLKRHAGSPRAVEAVREVRDGSL